MQRTMVGLLAAAGAVISAMVSFVHGDLAAVLIAGAAGSTGLAACLALPSKNTADVTLRVEFNFRSVATVGHLTSRPVLDVGG
jgi:hypothetical protein